MKVPIRSRYNSSDILHEIEIDDSYRDLSLSAQLGAAAQKAALLGLSLARSELRGADLRDTDLRGADLSCAALCGADLRWADLGDADLSYADLCGANLCDTDLRSTNLSYADLCGAELRGAKLRDADLRSTNLYGADLRDRGILQINGLHWPILIAPDYMQIGCEKHSHEAWLGFDNRRITEMGGREALVFWQENKDRLLGWCALARADRKQ